MNPIRLFIPILLLLRLTTTAQDSVHVHTKILFEPTPFLDTYNGTCLRLGIELPVDTNVGVYAIGGPYINSPVFSNITGQKGYYLKAGLRVYDAIKKNEPRKFGAFSFFYKNESFIEHDNIKTIDHQPGDPVTYHISKSTWGAQMEYGEVYAWKHLGFEFYVGAGFRFRTVVSSASDSLRAVLYHFHEGEATNISMFPSYRMLMPSFSLGIRLDYIFRKIGEQ